MVNFFMEHLQGEARQLRQDKSKADDKIQELEIVSSPFILY